ncbi:MAG TPA: PQQ-binding-like beta-propeller repeat protein [Sediminibacterium sp.]|nr:PQQ-binding-like beta-propeller repeat protein [Sediminibacterium sp.]
MKRKILCSVLLLSILTTSHAQFGNLLKKKKTSDESEQTSSKKEEAVDAPEDKSPSKSQAWNIGFDREINWFNLTSLGSIIVSTDDGLHSLNPVTGKENWKLEQFAKVSKANYTGIKGSPYIAILEGSAFNMKQNVIDISQGKVVCNTKELGLSYVTKRLPIPNLGALLFSGQNNKGVALMLVDLKTGQATWTINSVFERISEQMVADPLYTNNSIIIATTKRLYKLDAATGATQWKIDFETKIEVPLIGQKVISDDKESTQANEDKKTASMKETMAAAVSTVFGKFVTLDEKVAYYYNTQNITAIDIATGNINWPKTKLDDPIANVLFDDNGVLVATDDKKSELFLFDYATGSPKWSEPLKIAGRISSIKLTGTKLAVGASKQNGRNIVSVVDITTGKSLTASPLKVDGYILDLRLIDNVGLLYRTNQECNVLDLNTGKEQWSKSIKYSSGGLGLDKGDFTYFIGDNSIYEVNNKNGDHKEFANKKFGKEEIYRTIELMDQGIIVSSDQNVAMFNYAGSIVYHAYHPAPGISTFGKIMNIAAMGVSMAASASEGYQAGASGYGTSSYKSGMERADRWSNVASAAMSDLSKRFSASANAKNYKLVLTKVTTSDDSGVGLVRINKLTGKVDGKVVLDDKKPDYLFDEIENMLFYKDGNKKLVAYNFNK